MEHRSAGKVVLSALNTVVSLGILTLLFAAIVHISAVERAGLSSLNEGAKMSYEVVANRGKESAENLRVG